MRLTEFTGGEIIKAAKKRQFTAIELAIMEGGHLLDKPTPSINDLVKRHNVDYKYIVQQLAQGIQVELEHTSNIKIAKEIALDHLGERPDYYELLKKVEAENDMIENAEFVDVWAMQDEEHRKHLLSNPTLFENSTDYTNLREFLQLHATPSPVLNQSYMYTSVSALIPGRSLMVVHFKQPYILKKLINGQAFFEIDGKIRQYPDGELFGTDMLKYPYMFDSIKSFEKFKMLLLLKYGDWRVTITTIPV